MSGPGRNERCPCDSGLKYKRCCLRGSEDSLRLLDLAETALAELGGLAWDTYDEECRAGFARYYERGLAAFGAIGPSEQELKRAEAWFLCDRRLGIGQTPLGALEPRLSNRQGAELLGESAIRVWELLRRLTPSAFEARCPLTDERISLLVPGLSLDRESAASSELPLLVGRTIGSGHGWAGLLAPIDVDHTVRAELIEWVRSAWDGSSDREAFWHSFGGELSRAASAWPEVRHHTREGEVVRSSMSTWKVADVEAAAVLLEQDPELQECPPEKLDEPDERSWSWVSSDEPAPVAMAPRPGVRWTLDRPDAGNPREVAQIHLAPWESQIWVFAPTPQRLRRAEDRAHSTLGELLGKRRHREIEDPYIEPRWYELRLERLWGRDQRPDVATLSEAA